MWSGDLISSHVGRLVDTALTVPSVNMKILREHKLKRKNIRIQERASKIW